MSIEQEMLAELKAIKAALGDGHREPTLADAIAEVVQVKPRFYDKKVIDLGTAYTNSKIELTGSFLWIENLTGSAEIAFNDRDHDRIPLKEGRIFVCVFGAIYLTNTAQTGKTLTLVAGKERFAISSMPSIGDISVMAGGATGLEVVPGFLGHGEKDIASAGTQLALASTTPCRGVIITAKPANTGYIYVGGSTVSSTSYGRRLSAGNAMTIAIDDLAKIYIDASVNAEGVTYLFLA